ncbi:hypothetical protein OF117_14815 [Geodermatophilus sp. YIM 151500]|uniref:hypothetical protein n=1 Tax=Geodermatophilus sp. YIM 151500 TaxID=2984531 RepID=UPI0021E425C0|nr:hypothetical protein [Geodermatophilus sp. YIM 151500]MCV2490632.1 hypothetical protein [Geodermatophilus sp. YIM 151500]
MTVTAPHPIALADRGARRLRVAGALAGVGVRTALHRGNPRARQRAQVLAAARVLTALGVRVRVVPPDVAWPRTGGSLAVDGTAGRLGALATLTAVPRGVDGWADLADRAFAERAPAVRPPVTGTALPVAIRWLGPDGAPLSPHRVPDGPADAAAASGLVVEVRLLPAVDAPAPGPTGTGPGPAGTGPGPAGVVSAGP